VVRGGEGDGDDQGSGGGGTAASPVGGLVPAVAAAPRIRVLGCPGRWPGRT
jgi:hypothetical protein